MNDYLVSSNKREVENFLTSTFENARSIKYENKGTSLKCIIKYRNSWYNNCGAIDCSDCFVCIFLSTIAYSFFGGMDFLMIPNVVWVWIVFAVIFGFCIFISLTIICAHRNSEIITIIGLNILLSLATVLIYWQLQNANPEWPKTIHLDFLFKFHF